MKNLNRQETNKTTTRPLKLLQFGGGNFLRAFIDLLVHVLNQETDFNAGVMLVNPTETVH